MTTKVTFTDQARPDQTKPMSEMQPGEICQVVSSDYDGHIVMRSLNKDQLEVMDLSDFVTDRFWTRCRGITVRPYYGQVTLQRTEP